MKAFGIVIAATIVIVLAVIIGKDWRRASAVIRQTQDELRQAGDDALTFNCGWCRDTATSGHCTCTADCGHHWCWKGTTRACNWCTTLMGSCTCPGRCAVPGCQGEWTTSLTELTPADVELLRDSGIKGWTEQ